MKRFVLAAFALICTSASAQQVSKQDAYEISKDACIYAYPLMLTDVSGSRMVREGLQGWTEL
jgi:hypothetical protein